MKRVSFPRLLAISAFAFALTTLSNTLEPAVLGHKVLELVPERRNTALGFTTFAGLIVASYGSRSSAYSPTALVRRWAGACRTLPLALYRRRLLPAERIGDHPLALSEKALGIS